jgi:hypothetical protein
MTFTLAVTPLRRAPGSPEPVILDDERIVSCAFTR